MSPRCEDEAALCGHPRQFKLVIVGLDLKKRALDVNWNLGPGEGLSIKIQND